MLESFEKVYAKQQSTNMYARRRMCKTISIFLIDFD